MLNDPCSILIRLCVHNIALSTDTEKAVWSSNPDDAESDFDTYHCYSGQQVLPSFLVQHHVFTSASTIVSDHSWASIHWDKTLDQQMRDKWRDIVTDLQNATVTTMTQHYFTCETEDDNHTAYHLHTFKIIMSIKENGAVEYHIINFVIVKTWVTPISNFPLLNLNWWQLF